MPKSERAFDPEEPRFKGNLEVAEMPVIGRVYRVRHDVLGRMEKRGQITTDQWTAGDMFQTDYQLAGMDMLQAANLSPTIPGESAAKDEVSKRAAMRFRRAVQHLGPVGADLAMRVICANMTATDWAHFQGRTPEYGIDRLRECLDVLVEVYEVA